MWEEQNSIDINAEIFFKQSFEYLEILDLFNNSLDLIKYDSEKEKTWYRAIESFLNIARENKLSCFSDIVAFEDFFLKFKRITGPRKKEEFADVVYFLKKFKCFSKIC